MYPRPVSPAEHEVAVLIVGSLFCVFEVLSFVVRSE
jgi:hypothetical protein